MAQWQWPDCYSEVETKHKTKSVLLFFSTEKSDWKCCDISLRVISSIWRVWYLLQITVSKDDGRTLLIIHRTHRKHCHKGLTGTIELLERSNSTPPSLFIARGGGGGEAGDLNGIKIYLLLNLSCSSVPRFILGIVAYYCSIFSVLT